MGEPTTVVTNGATNTSLAASDSSPPPSQDDQPPIPEPPDIVVIEKQTCPHTLSAQQVADYLDTDLYDGLTSEEAADRLARDGSNSIKGAKGLSLWEIFLQQVANALTVVLIAVAALSFAISDYIEAGVVVAVILLNIVVGYVEQFTSVGSFYTNVYPVLFKITAPSKRFSPCTPFPRPSAK